MNNKNNIWNLKKYLILFICLILFYAIFITIPVFASEPLTLRVGAYENSPKIFTDDKGNVSGFWPDIINYIASKEGWQIEWVWCIWLQCMDKLENKEIDLMPDVGFTEPRSKKYAFSREIVLVSWSRLYARKDSDIETILDLEDKKIGALVGSFNLQGPEGIKELTGKFDLNCTFIEMNNYTEVFEALEKGEIDAGVTNKDFGNKHEKDFNIKRTPIIFQPAHMQFAFPKDSDLTPYLLGRIDYYIKELKEDRNSIYYQSLEKWFAEKISEKEIIPGWVNWLLIGAGGIVLLLFGGNFILKSQVRSKTKDLGKEINEHKATEKALREAHDQLEDRVAQRTQELQKANLKLQELDRLKSMFIASMSHELRTPLNSIIGFTGIILQGMSGEITGDQRKELTMVKNSANHLLTLINDVINVSKIETGKVELFIEEFDLTDLMQEVKESFKVAADEKDLKLSIEMPERLIIKGDERRTKQVIMNLMSNAVKFTDRGEIETKVRKEDKRVKVSVTDTGIGIKEEDMDKLFKQFSRIYAEGRPVTEGTGLGLYLSKKIVNLLGGQLKAESEFGKGSKFTFTFPLEYTEVKR